MNAQDTSKKLPYKLGVWRTRDGRHATIMGHTTKNGKFFFVGKVRDANQPWAPKEYEHEWNENGRAVNDEMENGGDLMETVE